MKLYLTHSSPHSRFLSNKIHFQLFHFTTIRRCTSQLILFLFLFNVISLFTISISVAQNNIDQEMSQLRQLYESGKPKEALQLAHQIRANLHRSPSIDRMYLFEVNTKIVGLHKRLKSPGKAIPFSVEAIEILKSLDKTEDFVFGIANINAAFLFRHTGDEQDEIQHFEVAFAVFEGLAKHDATIVPVMQQAGKALAQSYNRINAERKLDLLVERMEKFE